MNIDICKLELQNIDLKPRDSEKIRGYLENDILHNHNQDKFIYRYPMVQYKIIDKTAMIIGIGKASNLVANIGIIEDKILIDDKLINIYEKNEIISIFTYKYESSTIFYGACMHIKLQSLIDNEKFPIFVDDLTLGYRMSIKNGNFAYLPTYISEIRKSKGKNLWGRIKCLLLAQET